MSSLASGDPAPVMAPAGTLPGLLDLEDPGTAQPPIHTCSSDFPVAVPSLAWKNPCTTHDC